MAAPQNEILSRVTKTYLAELDMDNLPDPQTIEQELLDKVNAEFTLENTGRAPGNKIALLKTMTHPQIAQVLITLHHARRIAPIGVARDKDKALLAVYDPPTGLYDTSAAGLKGLARKYDVDLGIRGTMEVLDILSTAAPWVDCVQDRDLIAVNNGIFNYKTKELIPFSPEYVFLVKSAVDFDRSATSPVIIMPDGEEWEVEAWMRSLTDDDEIAHLLWEITGAVVRGGVSWGKGAFLHSEQGNNGKGTLLSLMRNLTGKWATIPLYKFNEKFALEGLLGAQAILTDENPVGTYIEVGDVFKAIITNDAFVLEGKGKPVVSYQFWGFMAQCVNDLPRTKDTSESFYRRQLFIPFTKNFTGVERKYIKDDYLHRDDVLQYVLKRVLVDMDDYYELSEPEACKALLAEHKISNDPVREFWEEFADRFTVSFLPVQFLHELYVAWSKRSNPDGTKMKERPFMKRLDAIARGTGDWVRELEANGVDTKRYDASVFNGQQEPLLFEYQLERWFFQDKAKRPLSSSSLTLAPMPKLRGLVRRQPVISAAFTGRSTAVVASTEEDAS